MGANTSIYVAISLMALFVYGTRIAGTELMTMFRMTPKVEAVLKAMATSVLIAIVASEVTSGGLRQSVAILVTAITMALSKNSLAAMTAGVAVAASYTWAYE